MMKDKRARIAVSIIDVYSYILFAMGMIVLIMLFSLRSCVSDDIQSKLVKSNIAGTDSHTTISNLLRTPVMLDPNLVITGIPENMEKLTIAELIVLWKSDPQFRAELDKSLGAVMAARYEGCVVLCIDDVKFAFNDCTLYNEQCENMYAETYEIMIQDHAAKPIIITFNPTPEHLAMTAVRYT